MALFQNRPDAGSRINYTSVGMNKTLLIVGLGNPGDDYADTRHNVGFMCIDAFANSNNFDPWINKKDLECHFTSQTMHDTRIILIKPQTFMNLSGESVQKVIHFYKVQPDQIVVVYDELDVAFGQIRMRLGGSSAGHNGVKSITKHIGEQYGRIRVGIGPKMPDQIDTADFVLQTFPKAQRADIPALTREVASVLSEYAFGSPITAETRSFL